MTYPNPTTYTLPSAQKIRVSSRCRFVLVRENLDAQFQENQKPFIVKRSDKLDVVWNQYNLLRDRVDTIIDQAEGTFIFWFNGRHEVVDIRTGVTLRTAEAGQRP